MRKQCIEWTDSAMEQVMQQLQGMQQQLGASRSECAALREENQSLRRQLCSAAAPGAHRPGGPCPALLAQQAGAREAAAQLQELERSNATLLGQQLQLLQHERATAERSRTAGLRLVSIADQISRHSPPSEELRALGGDVSALAFQVVRRGWGPEGDVALERDALVQVRSGGGGPPLGSPHCALELRRPQRLGPGLLVGGGGRGTAGPWHLGEPH
jgi:regulator of replication initiation timing